MRPDMPIEQLVRRTDTRFQLGFARDARARLPDGDDFLPEPSAGGLRILGRNEASLAAPVELLRDVYGPRLEVRPPRVRLIEGVQVRQPVMHVRISLDVQCVDAVGRVMLGRGALATEEYARGRSCVLRYEAPLADLLGLGEELARVTGGKASHWIALSHYAFVTRDPGGGAAA